MEPAGFQTGLIESFLSVYAFLHRRCHFKIIDLRVEIPPCLPEINKPPLKCDSFQDLLLVLCSLRTGQSPTRGHSVYQELFSLLLTLYGDRPDLMQGFLSHIFAKLLIITAQISL